MLCYFEYKIFDIFLEYWNVYNIERDWLELRFIIDINNVDVRIFNINGDEIDIVIL